MGILSWILLGLVAGAIARFIMPGPDSMGMIKTCLLGVAGAFVGGWLGTQFNFGTVEKFDMRSLGVAIVGALVVLAIFRLIRRKG